MRAIALVVVTACAVPPEAEITDALHGASCAWTQFGGAADHHSDACVRAQDPDERLATITMDPFAEDEIEDYGYLRLHYGVPLADTDGNLFVEEKTGTWTDGAYATQTWTEEALHWHHGHLEHRWTFASDWKPSTVSTSEETFQAALAGDDILIPGAAGSVYRLDKDTGHVRRHLQPFGTDASTYVFGGITADRDGTIYYNAVALAPPPADPKLTDIRGAWLVRIDRHDHVTTRSYADLSPTPLATDTCYKTFQTTIPKPARPWPPAPHADGTPTLPDPMPCGGQRPGLNEAPAVGDDGTIFLGSRTHLAGTGGEAFLIALRPDLHVRWRTSLRGLLHDGCGVTVTDCRAGATPGVDPATNLSPLGELFDASSASPVALPDGGVLLGTFAAYGAGGGNLIKLDRHGALAASYPFGSDITPGVHRHGGTYSVVIKNNHYFDPISYRIEQLDASLHLEWSFLNTETQTCERAADGTIACVDDGFHADGFEWCVNAPAIDREGRVHVLSEDGNLYVLDHTGALERRVFLEKSVAAAYTPTAIDPRGRILALNNGKLFVLGE